MKTIDKQQIHTYEEKSKNKHMQDYQKGYVKLLIICVVLIIGFIVMIFYGRIVEVSGDSMNDYIFDGGICVVKTGSFEINRYDIVLAKMDYKTAIKRVIGLPHDTVLIQEGVVYVNGTRCEEYDFYTEDAGIASQEIELKENEYFLLGDNRQVSYDSRGYGAFSREEIKGRVVKILWKGRD